jgi:hypothetical protein
MPADGRLSLRKVLRCERCPHVRYSPHFHLEVET